MPLSKNINTYSDIKRVLDTALSLKGVARFRTESPSAATRWRFRAYMFRRLAQESLAKSAEGIPGYTPSTPYDNMILRLRENEVLIDMHGVDISGELLDAQGKPLTLLEEPESTVDADDPLLLEAMKLAERGD